MAATATQDFLIGDLPGCRFSGERHFGGKPSGSEEALPAWERAAPPRARSSQIALDAILWLALNLLGQTNEIARLRMTSRCSGCSVKMVNCETDMNTRRDFLMGVGAAKGIVFCCCGMGYGAWTKQDGWRRCS